MSAPPPTSPLPFTLGQIRTKVARQPAQTQPILQQRTFTMYGAAMLNVQLWELTLGGLVLTVSPPSNSRNIDRALRNRLKQIQHQLNRATPQEMRGTLTGKVDAGLLDEIGDLLPVRNQLAHRYLRERVFDAATGRLHVPPEVPFELREIAEQFGASTQRLAGAGNAARQALPERSDPSEAVKTALSRNSCGR
jgi:hypothetical protein